MSPLCSCTSILTCLCGAYSPSSSSSSGSEHDLELNSNTLHTQGVHISNWLSARSPNCPIPPTTLTLSQIQATNPVESLNMTRAQGPDLKLPPTHRPLTDTVTAWTIKDESDNDLRFWTTNEYLAARAQDFGVQNNAEQGAQQDPAQLMAAIFKDQIGLVRMEHIFALDVQAETRDLAIELYGDEEYTRVVSFGTREYFMLLGSCVGRAVARGMLAAWPRGTKEVSDVAIWKGVGDDGEMVEWNLRFDVAQVKGMNKVGGTKLIVKNPDPPSTESSGLVRF